MGRPIAIMMAIGLALVLGACGSPQAEQSSEAGVMQEDTADDEAATREAAGQEVGGVPAEGDAVFEGRDGMDPGCVEALNAWIANYNSLGPDAPITADVLGDYATEFYGGEVATGFGVVDASDADRRSRLFVVAHRGADGSILIDVDSTRREADPEGAFGLCLGAYGLPLAEGEAAEAWEAVSSGAGYFRDEQRGVECSMSDPDGKGPVFHITAPLG